MSLHYPLHLLIDHPDQLGGFTFGVEHFNSTTRTILELIHTISDFLRHLIRICPKFPDNLPWSLLIF